MRRVNASVTRIVAGRGELLHTRSEVRRLTHRAVVHPEVAPDGAHDHLARVQADPDLRAESQPALQLIGGSAIVSFIRSAA